MRTYTLDGNIYRYSHLPIWQQVKDLEDQCQGFSMVYSPAEGRTLLHIYKPTPAQLESVETMINRETGQ